MADAEREPAAITPPPADDRPTELERVVGWLDSRTGIAAVTRSAAPQIFPDHWSFLLGEIAVLAVVVLVTPGTFMTFFYTPDARETIYDGPYSVMDGQPMSAAFASVKQLAIYVQGGVRMRH